jgi:hypothetical protein
LPRKQGKGFRQPSGTPPRNPSLPERPLRGFAKGGIRRCNYSFVVVGGQTAEKLAGSTVRFGLARAFYPARVPFAVHCVSFKSIFLFAFYNIISGGLPWSVALAMDETKQPWLAWSLLPWLVLIAGAIALWRKATESRLDLRLFRSQNCAPEERTLGPAKESAMAGTSLSTRPPDNRNGRRGWRGRGGLMAGLLVLWINANAKILRSVT